ncbi:MAG: chemotaxis protein CheW [Rhodospirillaceae bacterium]|nr:chemotaxis protein CheW [Rhodospirillaceae bacterium]
MDDLLKEFLTETAEKLSALDADLVALERAPDDPGLLRDIFRLLHTLKGTCGFLGLARLEKVAHSGENVLGGLRDGAVAASREAVSLILECLDRVRDIVAGIESTGAEPAGDDTDLLARLDAFPAPRRGPAAAAAGGREPAAAASAGDSSAAAAGDGGRDLPLGRRTIRMDVGLLDDLMTTVGELVLARNQVLQLLRAREESGFAAPLQRLDHVTAELQQSVMKARMQPIGTAWTRLPRLVRDLARELGKSIVLEMRGAETEVDRQVLELIRDPLTHLVRNCADHGLETPDERRAAGKAETGRITLGAFHRGGHVVIEVADDGRGLATGRIRAKALESGLAGAAQLAAMSPQQIHQLVFRPGFTTSERVSSVSGRGVGLDVVRTNLDRIGGTIEIRSVDGVGTTFTMRVPLTLAIVPALIVACGEERFAIPQAGIAELVRVSPRSGCRIERIKMVPVLALRDRLMPVVSLGDALELPRAGRRGTRAADEGFVVVLQVGATRFGVAVDAVLDIEEIVVKPLAPILGGIPVFSGSTILGDGCVVMILDPDGLAAAAGCDAAAVPAAAGTVVRADDPEKKARLLLFHGADGRQCALPLAPVARVEEIRRAAIERADGRPVVQSRGQLLPLVPLDGDAPGERALQPVVVLSDGDRTVGLMVDAVIDIVEERLAIDRPSRRPGCLGSAILGGRTTDVIDAGHYLERAFPDGFGADETFAHPVATGDRVGRLRRPAPVLQPLEGAA